MVQTDEILWESEHCILPFVGVSKIRQARSKNTYFTINFELYIFKLTKLVANEISFHQKQQFFCSRLKELHFILIHWELNLYNQNIRTSSKFKSKTDVDVKKLRKTCCSARF